MTELILKPGDVTLADWRAIYRGAVPPLDPGLPAGDQARAPRRSRAIVATGEPVYGINTGFGKLASVRIAAADLATLQRNIVLSHAAGVGEPMPVADRAADDGAEARQPGAGRLGRAAGDGRAARGHARARTSSRSCRRKARSAPPAISRRSRT